MAEIGDRFEWETIDGNKYGGTIKDIDNYTAIVSCDDGKLRATQLTNVEVPDER